MWKPKVETGTKSHSSVVETKSIILILIVSQEQKSIGNKWYDVIYLPRMYVLRGETMAWAYGYTLPDIIMPIVQCVNASKVSSVGCTFGYPGNYSFLRLNSTTLWYSLNRVTSKMPQCAGQSARPRVNSTHFLAVYQRHFCLPLFFRLFLFRVRLQWYMCA